MKNRFKTFLFEATVILVILSIAIFPMCIGGCLAAFEPIHYYKIQRLNINEEVMQTYYSKSYPWGIEGCVDFREYPSGKWIKMNAPYTAEDLGTNKPTL